MNSKMFFKNQDKYEYVNFAYSNIYMKYFKLFESNKTLNNYGSDKLHTAFIYKCRKSYIQLDMLGLYL